MIKVSVVIPTFNSWVTLRTSITTLLKQNLSPTEIIVVNNASTDKTDEMIKKNFPQVKLVNMKENTGVTGGRNAGIRKASKKIKYVLLFDHDMDADKKMLEELVKIAQRSPMIGIVTPKVYYFSDRKRIWSAGTGINLWTGQVLFRGGEDRGQYEQVAEVQVAPAAMLVKRNVLNKVKGFDDQYFAVYEDTDFCFRVRKLGFKIYYAPKAIAYHRISTSPQDEAQRLMSRAYLVGRNKVIFMKKFSKNFIIFLFFLPLYSLYYMKLALQSGQPLAWLKYLQGTVAGLIIAGRKPHFLKAR